MKTNEEMMKQLKDIELRLSDLDYKIEYITNALIKPLRKELERLNDAMDASSI